MVTTLSCLLALPLVFAPVPPGTPAAGPGRVPGLLDQAHSHLVKGDEVRALALIDEALLLDQSSGRARALCITIDGAQQWGLSAGDRAVARRVLERTTTVDGAPAELGEVLDDVERVAGIDIFVDWPALERIGIRRDDRVTPKAREVTAAALLDELMKLVGDRTRPLWRIGGDRVTVTAPAALRERTWTVVYDVRDVARDDDGSVQRDAVEWVIEQLRTTIDPGGWKERGGDRNRLQELNGNLIITSTPWNHRSIEAMLTNLRRERAASELIPGSP